MKLFIEKKKSEKSNKEFNALVADMGYVTQVLTYDNAIMINLANLAPADYYKRLEKVGNQIVLFDSAK